MIHHSFRAPKSLSSSEILFSLPSYDIPHLKYFNNHLSTIFEPPRRLISGLAISIKYVQLPLIGPRSGVASRLGYLAYRTVDHPPQYPYQDDVFSFLLLPFILYRRISYFPIHIAISTFPRLVPSFGSRAG
jgi:hypothetical protein